MGKVRKPNQPLLALSAAAAATAASAADESMGAEIAADEDAATASTSKSARVSEVKKWFNESACCGNS